MNKPNFLLRSLLITSLFIFSNQVVALDSAPTNATPIPDRALPQQPNTTPTTGTVNQPSFTVPPAPNIDAQGFILIDTKTGKVLAEKNADERRPPASLTKLTSLYLMFRALSEGRIHLDDKVRVSKKAWKTGGSRMFIRVGTEVPVNELLQGITVDSGNDATVAMAEYVAGSEDAFVALMNQTAQAHGMTNTHYTDATGMPHPQHFTTPRDVSKIASAIIREFPDYYHYFSQKWFTYNGIRQPNRNRLLWRYKYADGMKTGHTKAAGYCLVASAKQNDMRLLSVVMGTPSDNARAEDSQRLLTYGFRFFEDHKLYSANETLSTPRVWKGKLEKINVGIQQDMYITLPTGQARNLKTTLTIDSPLIAPIEKNQKVGSLKVTLGGKVVASAPLVAYEADPLGGLWRRTSDSLRLSIHKMTND